MDGVTMNNDIYEIMEHQTENKIMVHKVKWAETNKYTMVYQYLSIHVYNVKLWF